MKNKSIVIAILCAVVGFLGILLLPNLFPSLGNFAGYFFILVYILMMSFAIIWHKNEPENRTFSSILKVSFSVFFLITMFYILYKITLGGGFAADTSIQDKLLVLSVTTLGGIIMSAILALLFKTK